MASPHTGTPLRAYRRLAVWAGLSVGWLLPSAGCQVEYAGMTLPSGKYMHDDVQYLPPGPNFPWANTQAATQRARMQAMGIETPPPETGALGIGNVPGAINPIQNQLGRPTDVNASPLSVEPPLPPEGGSLPGRAESPAGSRACRTRSRLPARCAAAPVSQATHECPGRRRHSSSNRDATPDPTIPSGSGVAFVALPLTDREALLP